MSWRWGIFAVVLVTGCSSKAEKTLHGDALKDPQSCTQCHAGHVAEWSGSMHAYASDDPVFLAMNARGQRETKGALGGFCVRCHAPVAFASGLSKDGLNLDKVPAFAKGVTCYFCHSATAVAGTHDNPLVIGSDEVFRAAIADPLDNPAHAAEYAPLLDRDQRDSASLCGSCHDIVNGNGVALERTFAEWKTSQFGNGAKTIVTCGNCHMPSKPKKLPAADFPGVGSRKVHDHTWAGVDTALTPLPQGKEQADEIKSLIGATVAAQLCISPPLADFRLDVVLENANAGHDFPSGAGQDRRLWVELIGYQGDKVLFQNGVMPPTKVIGEAHFDSPDLLFRDTISDAGGKEVHMFWEAASQKSNLLKPAPDPGHRFQRSLKYSLKDGPPDRITMNVYVQPIGREILQSLVDSGDLDKKYLDSMPIYPAHAPIEWTTKSGNGCLPKCEFGGC